MEKDKILKIIGGLGIGLGVGLCFGVAMSNILVGLGIGLGVGSCYAAAFTANKPDEIPADKEDEGNEEKEKEE